MVLTVSAKFGSLPSVRIGQSMLGFVERDAHRLHASRREESRQLNVYLVHRYISAEHPHVMRASFVVGKRTGGVIGNAQTANGRSHVPAGC